MHADPALGQAFRTIRKYDPALFVRMSRDDQWAVAAEPGSPDEAVALFGAFGVTGESTGGSQLTIVNFGGIANWSARHHVPLATFMAVILGHEYVHTTQGDEPESLAVEEPAFDASDAFARKLPVSYRGVLLAQSRRARKSPHYLEGNE